MVAEPPAEADPNETSQPATSTGSSVRSAEPDSPGASDEPGEPEVTASRTIINIDRARWSEEDGELEVRGDVSSLVVTLTLSFLGRSEALANDSGSFRAELSGVNEQPFSVTVTASDGASVRSEVEADLESD
jgi:hypothetical protein